jgi:alkanesulfonate monooxygenase SsuD/methylene tetrahydromethanopterin reductase-like flavin-dependent oxidoreductase (luciferase family)
MDDLADVNSVGREDGMRFALMIEGQMGLSYEDHLAIVRRAEAAGFESFFRSDHYASFPGADDRPTTDAWTVLAGLARETSRISLGVLVSPVTFRHPGNFAKVVTTVDHMSGGRIEVGVGAGWNAQDHDPLGLPYPEMSARADLMEDQLELLHRLWTQPPGWSWKGHQVEVRDGALRPGAVEVPGRPIENGRVRPRILTGGEGSPRGFRIAARYADEFNLSSSSPDVAREKQAALDEACRAVGRDPKTLTRSTMAGVLIGRDAAELERRTQALLVEYGLPGGNGAEWLNARRKRWILGTPDEALAMVRRYADAGIERVMLQDFLPHDLEHIDDMAEALIGKV